MNNKEKKFAEKELEVEAQYWGVKERQGRAARLDEFKNSKRSGKISDVVGATNNQYRASTRAAGSQESFEQIGVL